MQTEEHIIAEYPYRPFGWLIVTSKRLIFKRMPPWINTFSGVIKLSDTRDIKLIKGKSFLTDPCLEFTY